LKPVRALALLRHPVRPAAKEKRFMRIALVAPLCESVRPTLYGGTERVVSYLAEELVQQGHDVTLFASGDSTTRATLVPIIPQALRLGRAGDPLAAHVTMLGQVASMATRFDVVHYPTDFLHFPQCRAQRHAPVTT